MTLSPTLTRVAIASAILWTATQPIEVWAQSEAPAAPAAVTVIATSSHTEPEVDVEVNVTAADEPSLEDMQTQLKAMSAQLQSLATEMERTNAQSQALVEQTLKLLQQQTASDVAAPRSESNFDRFPSRVELTPPPGMKVQLTLPSAEQRATYERHVKIAKERDATRWKEKASRRTFVTRKWDQDNAARTLFRGNGLVDSGETVEEFVLFSGNGEVRGDVERDAVLLAGNLVVRKGAHIGGDAVVLAGNLSVEEGARIDGKTVVTAGKLDVKNGAIIGGDQIQMGLSDWDINTIDTRLEAALEQQDDEADEAESEEITASDHHSEDGFFDNLVQVLTRFLLLSAAGLLLMTFLPSRTQIVGRTLHRRMGAAAMTGVLASFSLLPLGLLMTVSIVGIPLVPVLVAVAAFAVIMGMAAISLEIGRRLPMQRRAPAWMMAAGAGLLAILSEVPVLGAATLITLSFVGMGAVLLSRFGEPEAASDF